MSPLPIFALLTNTLTFECRSIHSWAGEKMNFRSKVFYLVCFDCILWLVCRRISYLIMCSHNAFLKHISWKADSQVLCEKARTPKVESLQLRVIMRKICRKCTVNVRKENFVALLDWGNLPVSVGKKYGKKAVDVR